MVLTLGLDAVEVNTRVGVPLPTEKLWKPSVAAFQLVLPAWFAKTLQVPTAWNETAPDAIEQTADDAASIVNATVPDPVAVAVGEYVAPETTAEAGAVLEKVMV